MKATIRPSTYNSYVQHVECHIAPHIGGVKLAKLTGSQVNALYAKLAESGAKDGKHGLSAMTIHHVHSCLHKACKDAVRWGHIAGNPLDAADPPRKKGDGTREMRTWTKEQLKAFLESVKDERLYGLWHTIAMTGRGQHRCPSAATRAQGAKTKADKVHVWHPRARRVDLSGPAELGSGWAPRAGAPWKSQCVLFCCLCPGVREPRLSADNRLKRSSKSPEPPWGHAQLVLPVGVLPPSRKFAALKKWVCGRSRRRPSTRMSTFSL